MDSSLTSPPPDPPETPAPRRKGPRRLAAAVVALGALLLTGCQLPSFGFHKGSTTQGQSTFHLWQGFFIAGHLAEHAWLADPGDEGVQRARQQVFAARAARATSTMARGVFTWAANESTEPPHPH